MASITGTCNCGSIRISLSAAPLKAIACHCHNCRRAGGPYSINYLFDESEVKVDDVQNTLAVYEDRKTVSGNLVKRHFCNACGSPIYSIDINLPGKLLIKASLFDEIVKERVGVFLDREIKWSS